MKLFLYHLLQELCRKVDKMSAELDALTTQVAANIVASIPKILIVRMALS